MQDPAWCTYTYDPLEGWEKLPSIAPAAVLQQQETTMVMGGQEAMTTLGVSEQHGPAANGEEGATMALAGQEATREQDVASEQQQQEQGVEVEAAEMSEHDAMAQRFKDRQHVSDHVSMGTK